MSAEKGNPAISQYQEIIQRLEALEKNKCHNGGDVSEYLLERILKKAPKIAKLLSKEDKDNIITKEDLKRIVQPSIEKLKKVGL